MSAIKKCWITEWIAGMRMLTIESEFPQPTDPKRVQAKELFAPVRPTESHPLRHTIAISLLDDESLMKIRDAIDGYLRRT